jgi:hypothetical protein
VSENYGKPIRGARRLAAKILNDPEKTRAMYSEPMRREFGLIMLAGRLTGFEQLINDRLAEKIAAARRGEFEPCRRSPKSAA